jgi:hypothetical protein
MGFTFGKWLGVLIQDLLVAFVVFETLRHGAGSRLEWPHPTSQQPTKNLKDAESEKPYALIHRILQITTAMG